MTKTKRIVFIIFILTILSILFFFPKTDINIERIEEIKGSFGILAPMIFVLIFAISSVFFIPITFLTVASGVIFGPFWGTLYAVISATIGAFISFLMSRYLLKNFIYKLSPAKVSKLNELIKRNEWEIIIITTISPFVNFNLENYFFGVTDISIKTFLLATFISLIPGSFAFSYLGYTGLNLLSGNRFIHDIVITVILFTALAFLPYLYERAFKKVKLTVSLF